ncbi:ACT domain-containing protein ACR10 [Carex littledalei]|uniref:ACT domain-containing protein ACR n=1 Tax=Carex littledalei TaxID=544730 RepID=A0A833QVH2_9POAL|nr:ACT domain-containing protein ACR10 [Carex littledalei]
MGISNDDVVLEIREPESAGEPSVLTISCPDKTGLGCDLCRVILLFGLNIVKGDMSTDGRWCYIVFWVLGRGKRATRWSLLKKRLLQMCPEVSMALVADEVGVVVQKPQVYFLKFSCYDRMGLLHDVTQVLCELELTIRNVKVSTTPDGRVLDLFFITDNKEQLHLKMRREETCDKLSSVLGDSMTSCDIEVASDPISCCVNASLSLSPTVTEKMFAPELPKEESSLFPCNFPYCNSSGSGTSNSLSVKVDNLLSPAHTLIQIQSGDHKGLLYDIMRTLKDYNIQLSYGRFYTSQNGICEIDLFVVQMDGRKIVDPQIQEALCFRLRMELYRPLRVILANRGPDTELLVANPVEGSGKGRPLVFYDITHALTILQVRIFLAEIGRHVVGDREWEVYRVHLGEDHELSASHTKIVEQVTKMLMGWD